MITIIGILIALLLPAVQAAREAARRMQCQNNLKQLGLAVLNYESQWEIFPPSSHWSPATAANIEMTNNPNLRESWVVMVLPFLEQQPLHDQFDLTKPTPDPANQAARSTRLSVVLCPSDPFNQKPFNGSSDAMTNQMGDGWARCNYAANAALGYMCYASHGGGHIDAAFADHGLGLLAKSRRDGRQRLGQDPRHQGRHEQHFFAGRDPRRRDLVRLARRLGDGGRLPQRPLGIWEHRRRLRAQLRRRQHGRRRHGMFGH